MSEEHKGTAETQAGTRAAHMGTIPSLLSPLGEGYILG